MLAGESPSHSTYVILGGDRCELASIDAAGALHQWISAHSGTRTDQLIRLARLTGGPVTLRADPDVHDEPAGDIRDVVIRDLHWTARLEASDRVLSEAACERDDRPSDLLEALLPGGGDPTPDGSLLEYDGGLSARVNAMLDSIELPAANEVSIQVRAEVTELALGAEGLQLISRAGTTENTEPLAIARTQTGVGPGWNVTMEAFGRSPLLTVAALDGSPLARRLLVSSPGELEESARLEQLRVRHGLPTGLMLRGDVGGPAAPPTSHTSKCTVTTRLVPGGASPFLVPLTTADLADISLDVEVSVTPPELAILEVSGAVQQSCLAVVDSFVVNTTHEITVEFDGSQAATRRFETAGSASLDPPTLDFPETRSWDFTVDRSGHLVDPAHARTCPVCAEVSCAACGESGKVLGCVQCAQPACGQCRRAATRHTAPEAPSMCGDCHRPLCAACGRADRALVCSICASPTCHDCVVDSHCHACAALVQTDASAVPKGFHAADHRVLRGTWRQVTVLVIAGGLRAEIVRIEADAVVAWRDYSGLDHPEWLAFFASSAAGPVSEIAIRRSEPAQPFDVPELVLDESVETLAQLVRPDGVAVGGLTDVGESPLRDVGDRLSVDLPRTVEHLDPSSWPESVPDVSAAGQIATLALSHRTTRTVADADGVHVIVAAGDDTVASTLHRYRPADVSSLPQLTHLASSVERAECGEHRVVRVQVGELVLITTDPSRPDRWYRVDRRPEPAESFLIGRALFGTPTPIAIADAVDGASVSLLRVRNGSLVGRSTSFTAEPAENDILAMEPQEALRRLGWTMPAELRAARPRALEPNADAPRPKVQAFNVGLTVTDRWSTPWGEVSPVYAVDPGASAAAVAAFDTGGMAHDLEADAEGHLVEVSTACSYCARASCSRCVVPVDQCGLCGVNRCDSCGPRLHGSPLCRACHSLTPEAGLGNRLRQIRGGIDARGSDTVHRVRVQGDQSEAVITTEAGGQLSHHVLNSIQLELLARVLDSK